MSGEGQRWVDITTPLRDGMAVYPGDPEVRVRRIFDIERGDAYTLSTIEAGLHSGTHVEAPVHFIPGARGIETIDLDALVGEALVVDVRDHHEHVGAVHVQRLVPEGVTRVLFRTKSQGLAGAAPALTGAAAETLVERGVRFVGIDSDSVAPHSDPGPVHVTLLGAGVAVAVGLNLEGVEEGRYELLCLPLLIPGADGAPARALLRRLV